MTTLSFPAPTISPSQLASCLQKLQLADEGSHQRIQPALPFPGRYTQLPHTPPIMCFPYLTPHEQILHTESRGGRGLLLKLTFSHWPAG
jgi:hypothetical protein